MSVTYFLQVSACLIIFARKKIPATENNSGGQITVDCGIEECDIVCMMAETTVKEQQRSDIPYHERTPADYYLYRESMRKLAKCLRRDNIFIPPPDPLCECGERNFAVIDQLGQVKHLVGFSDTCYECAVVSSD